MANIPKHKPIRCPHCDAILDQNTLDHIHRAVAKQFGKRRASNTAGPGRKSILLPCPYCKRQVSARESRVHQSAHRRGQKCPKPVIRKNG